MCAHTYMKIVAWTRHHFHLPNRRILNLHGILIYYMLVTFKFVEYNGPELTENSKHTETFPFRVRDCLLFFYTPPPAPQDMVSPPPFWLWHQRKKGGKAGKGEEGQSEIPEEGCRLCRLHVLMSVQIKPMILHTDCQIYTA